MLLIAGLGNPDDEYQNTRHNIGYKIVLQLCKKLDIDFFEQASTYRANKFLKTKVGEREVVFCLPLGYMNNSGTALHQLMDFYGDSSTSDLWIIHDDTEVPFGQIRVKFGGTSGGHNGIKSIDESIGEKYWRLRVGVGRPESREHDLAKYVLAKFTPDQQKILPTVIDRAVDFLVQSIEQGKLNSITFDANENTNQSH